jgi:hypothetical protein
MLDKSKGLVRGPELVTNGDFATDTDWLGIVGGTNLTIAGGQATFTISANFRGAVQTANYAAGTWLEIMFDLVSVSAGNVQFIGKTNDDGISGGTPFSLSASSPGSYKTIVLISPGVESIAIRNTVSGSTTVIDNVSVRELLGNHAVQTTAARRPTYTEGSGLAWLADDAVDDALGTILPDLGTGATVAFASDTGTTILTAQTIGDGDFDILRNSRLYGMIILDRAFTVGELSSVTAYLNAKRGS